MTAIVVHNVTQTSYAGSWVRVGYVIFVAVLVVAAVALFRRLRRHRDGSVT